LYAKISARAREIDAWKNGTTRRATSNPGRYSNGIHQNVLLVLLVEFKAYVQLKQMEDTIKQTNEDKKRVIESLNRLRVQYKTLDGEKNQLRDSIGVGLDKENQADDIELIENFLG
jgi:hypothetical protein